MDEFDRHLARLSSGSPAERQDAIAELARAGDARAVQALVQVVRHSDIWIRVAAIRALGQLGDPAAAGALIRLLRGQPREPERSAVVAVLGALCDRLDAVLLGELIESGDGGLARLAREALRRLRDPADVEPLIRVAARGSDLEQRGAAIEALAQIGTPRAQAFLAQMLTTPDLRVRQLVLRVAEKLSGPEVVKLLVASLGSPDEEERLAAERGLFGQGEAALASATLSAFRARAVDPSRLSDPRWLLAFERALDDSAPRPEAAPALARLGAVAPQLAAEQLACDDPDLRRAAAVVLGRLGTASLDALPSLVRLTSDDARPAVREACRDAVQRIEAALPASVARGISRAGGSPAAEARRGISVARPDGPAPRSGPGS